MIANNSLIMSPWLQLSSELTQAPISQHPLTPITTNGLPDEDRGVIPALMINNIKMKTKSILQSFHCLVGKHSPLLWPADGKALQIVQPAEPLPQSGPDAPSHRLVWINESNWENNPFPNDGLENTNCCLPWRCHCFPFYQFSEVWNNLEC